MSFDETETVGIPIAPIMGWNNFHFFYWWDCRRNEIEFTNKRWIERGETIMTLKEMKIPSPFSGQVVNEYGSGTVKEAIDGLTSKFLSLGNHLDSKKRFDSHEDFLTKAEDLFNVKAVKLTNY